MRRLLKLIGGMGSLRDVIVSHSTNRDELERFLLHLKEVYPGEVDRVFEMGAALGVHGGPGMIIVAGCRA
jgi:hypothetical protein